MISSHVDLEELGRCATCTGVPPSAPLLRPTRFDLQEGRPRRNVRTVVTWNRNSMKSLSGKIRLILIAMSLAAMAWLMTSSSVASQASRELTPQEQRGKQIYLKGESEGGEITAALGNGELELPAASFPCSNCHGLRGEGSKEGGLQPPPLDWRSLSSPHQSQLTRNKRAPYTDVTLARSISLGVDSSGGRLHPGMPRYKMTASQMADLIAYLKSTN